MDSEQTITVAVRSTAIGHVDRSSLFHKMITGPDTLCRALTSGAPHKSTRRLFTSRYTDIRECADPNDVRSPIAALRALRRYSPEIPLLMENKQKNPARGYMHFFQNVDKWRQADISACASH